MLLTHTRRMDSYKCMIYVYWKMINSYFPPYHALPLVRKETLKEYPEIEEVLGCLKA